jgi:RecB family exonuclease
VGVTVISGPPGSGREGAILDRFEETLERDPLLVVPTADDVDRLERFLCGRSAGGSLGGSVTTLPRLFEAVARSAGVPIGAPLSRMQRIWLARAAAASTRLRLLRRSAEREGFAPSLEDLLADLGAAGLDAAGFAEAVAVIEDAPYEAELATLLAAYERLRDELGATDEHALAAKATAALRSDPDSWRSRPVLLYGFDDLSRQQIELVDALGRACDVTIAITFELERPALAARAELRGILIDELGAVAEPPLPRRSGRPATLQHLERNLFEPDPPAIDPSDGSLQLIEGAGDRSEAELIGRRIAELIATGTDPDLIAVAVRSPDRQAPLLARVLSAQGLPVAPEARVPIAGTSTGAVVLGLLAIVAPAGTAAQVVSFLRGPARADQRSVDWLERRVLRDRLRTATEALAAWKQNGGRDIWELDALSEAEGHASALAGALTRVARDVAERPHRRTGFVPSSGPAVELRAAAEIARALDESARLGPHAPAAGEIAELLSHVRVPLWRGPTEGRVRILSPYRLRATRVDHLFVAGLTDGSFPARGGGDPLLAAESRGELGIAVRRDPAEEERYLFYSCVSRPGSTLHLAYAASDESGAPIPRSPFVDEVRGLLSPAPTTEPADDVLEASISTRAGPDEVVPEPGRASTRRELARSLAAEGAERAAGLLGSLEIPDELAAEVLARIEGARDARLAATEPGPLADPAVLAALSVDHPYGASTLEEFDTCPYRWFVGHELRPRPLGPDPEPLEDGGLVHAALERLYGSPPTEEGRPEPETVAAWERAAATVVREVAAERGWDLAQAQARIRIARFDAVLARFVRRDADTGGPLRPDPDLLEASFGERPDDRFDPVALNGFRLHGRIDRIDVGPGKEALIRDYKLSAKAIAGEKLIAEGKLQMPLYMLAARSFGLEPIGGLYSPLGASKDDRPRGLVDKTVKDSLVPGGTKLHFRTDFVEPERLEEILTEAEQRASEHVSDMRSGRIGRRPRGGQCPTWCAMAPICRIERGASVPDPDEEDEEGG